MARSRPANRDNPSWIRCHRSSAVPPGMRLVVAIAPGFTIGFVRPPGPRSTAATELNGRPVAFDADPLARPLAAERLAGEREDERLRDAHDRERARRRRPKTPPSAPATQMPNSSRGTRASAG